jgi:hypothetical protein
MIDYVNRALGDLILLPSPFGRRVGEEGLSWVGALSQTLSLTISQRESERRSLPLPIL